MIPRLRRRQSVDNRNHNETTSYCATPRYPAASFPPSGSSREVSILEEKVTSEDPVTARGSIEEAEELHRKRRPLSPSGRLILGSVAPNRSFNTDNTKKKPGSKYPGHLGEAVHSPVPSLPPPHVDRHTPRTAMSNTLTPPPSLPRVDSGTVLPYEYMIHAKRLGNEVRRNHSKRRRRQREPSEEGSGMGQENDQQSSVCNLWSNPQPEDQTSGETDASAEDDLLDDCEHSPDSFMIPLAASPEERLSKYWTYCYGGLADQSSENAQRLLSQVGVSAKRNPPPKGCLSVLKPKKCQDGQVIADDGNSKNHSNVKKTVQFGSPQAVEYEVDEPAQQLTPMPAQVARERYSMLPAAEADDDDDNEANETRHNTSILAEWEKDYDSPRQRNRRRRHKDRRSSALFTPSPKQSTTTNKGDQHRRNQASEEDESPSEAVANTMASIHVSTPDLSTGDNDASFETQSSQESLDWKTFSSAESSGQNGATNLENGTLNLSYSPSTVESLHRSSTETEVLSEASTTSSETVFLNLQENNSPVDDVGPPSSSIEGSSTPSSGVAAPSNATPGGDSSNASQSAESTPPFQSMVRRSWQSIHSVGGALESPPDDPVQAKHAPRIIAVDSRCSRISSDSSLTCSPATMLSHGNDRASSDSVCGQWKSPDRSDEMDLEMGDTGCVRNGALLECNLPDVFSSLASTNKRSKLWTILSCVPTEIIRTAIESFEQDTADDQGLLKDGDQLCSDFLSYVDEALDDIDEVVETDFQVIESIEFHKLPKTLKGQDRRIDMLQNDIKRIREEFLELNSRLGAVHKRRASLAWTQCQAMKSLGDLNVVELTDDRMVVGFDHLQTDRMIHFELDLQSFLLRGETVAIDDPQNTVKTTFSPHRSISSFYSKFVDEILLIYQGQNVEPGFVQGTFLGLSILFGRLRCVATDLSALHLRCGGLKLDFPNVAIALSQDIEVVGQYNVASLARTPRKAFVPEHIEVKRDGVNICTLSRELLTPTHFSWLSFCDHAATRFSQVS